MIRKSIQYLMLVGLILSNQAFCVGGMVHDPTNYARAFEILKAAKQQIEETKRVQEELLSTKNLIGNFKQEASELRNEFLNWRTYYDKIDTLDANDFSLMSWLGLDRFHPKNNAPEAFRLVDDKLFRSHASQVDKENYNDVINRMQYEREKVARNSIVTGIVVAEKSKSNLGESKKKIVSATDKSINGSDLTTILKAQNELLGVIASELIQQRELQAQMLEFMTAHASNQYGTSKNEPPKKSTFKSSF